MNFNKVIYNKTIKISQLILKKKKKTYRNNKNIQIYKI